MADELFRQGIWPSADALLAKLGRGSKSTIHRVQRQWRDALPLRFAAKGPAALERLPESALHIVEALYLQLLEEAQQRVHGEDQATHQALERRERQIDVQSHVLTLREGELESRLRDRERTTRELEARLKEALTLLAQETAARALYETRLAATQQALLKRRKRRIRPAAPRATPRPRRKSTSPVKRRRAKRPVTRARRRP